MPAARTVPPAPIIKLRLFISSSPDEDVVSSDAARSSRSTVLIEGVRASLLLICVKEIKRRSRT